MRLPRLLQFVMIATDVSFVLYWFITLLHVIPSEALFKDYENPILQAWNWSFLPLDLLVSVTGFTALWLDRKGDERARLVAVMSLTLTCTSGLLAISFWMLRDDYLIAWWLPNLALLLYPLPFLAWLLRGKAAR
jgi:CHASE2 domain-containing sensor protein